MASVEIYINGTFYPKEDAKISVYDHGLLYGDGVFEGMRAYSGNVFRLTEHLVRLYESARAIQLTIPMTQNDLGEAVKATLARNNLVDAYIRLVVTRGAGSLGLDPAKTSNPQVIIIADHIELYPKDKYEEWVGDHYCGNDSQSPGGAQSAHQVAKLSQQHLGANRRQIGRMFRSLDAQSSREVAECTAITSL